jgi:hypothetical protein
LRIKMNQEMYKKFKSPGTVAVIKAGWLE